MVEAVRGFRPPDRYKQFAILYGPGAVSGSIRTSPVASPEAVQRLFPGARGQDRNSPTSPPEGQPEG